MELIQSEAPAPVPGWDGTGACLAAVLSIARVVSAELFFLPVCVFSLTGVLSFRGAKTTDR